MVRNIPSAISKRFRKRCTTSRSTRTWSRSCTHSLDRLASDAQAELPRSSHRHLKTTGCARLNWTAFYAEPFSFARLALETYTDDTEGLLDHEQAEEIQESDASYKNRAINYLKAIRAGGTVLGIELAAKSALNRASRSSGELPRAVRPVLRRPSDIPYHRADQIDRGDHPPASPGTSRRAHSRRSPSREGNPISGTFKLTMPLGPGGGKEEVQNTTTTYALPFDVDFGELTASARSAACHRSEKRIGHGGPFPGNPIRYQFHERTSRQSHACVPRHQEQHGRRAKNKLCRDRSDRRTGRSREPMVRTR